MAAFDLLNPKVQKVIFDMKWGSFRPIQEEAVIHLISHPSDVIISAPTAGGKTEAALLPIISQIAESGRNNVKILYISPLKALINDQFHRIEQLCRYIDFPITKWHGDANASRKEKLLEKPAGILLITPESIEAILLNKSEYLFDLFGKVDYIVLDEVHSFIGNERGTQLKSLIRRIEKTVGIHPIKIALSATISNMQDIAGWLNPEHPETVKIIEDKSEPKETVGLIKCYLNTEKTISGIEADYFDSQEVSARTEKVNVLLTRKNLYDDLFKATQTGKTLIFSNSKAVLEEYCAVMQKMARENNFPNHYFIHHGSLAKNIREETEQALKTSSNIAVFCTNTLELGIDIGNIDRVLFLDAPSSVASMVQKLGRSGRKAGSRREFRFFLEEKFLGEGQSEPIQSDMSDEPLSEVSDEMVGEASDETAEEVSDETTSTDIRWDDILRTNLVQSIAIVELMLEKFSEPLDTVHFDYSTFVHQILSYLGQTGGAKAARIYQMIAENSFNGAFSKADFIAVLKGLYQKKMIYQLKDDTITLHRKGEQLVESYDFYAAFLTPQMWKVVYNGHQVGEIGGDSVFSLDVGSHLLLAGKAWQVIDFKYREKIMLVEHASTGETFKFSGGMQNVHPKVHQKMWQIYESHFIPPYLSARSVPILQEGFTHYDQYVKAADGNVLGVFAGTKVHRTIELLFRYFRKNVSGCIVGFATKEDRSELIDLLKGLDLKTLDFEHIVNMVKRDLKYFNKFDYLLPDAILNKSYIQQHLDIQSTIDFVNTL